MRPQRERPFPIAKSTTPATRASIPHRQINNARNASVHSPSPNQQRPQRGRPSPIACHNRPQRERPFPHRQINNARNAGVHPPSHVINARNAGVHPPRQINNARNAGVHPPSHVINARNAGVNSPSPFMERGGAERPRVRSNHRRKTASAPSRKNETFLDSLAQANYNIRVESWEWFLALD